MCASNRLLHHKKAFRRRLCSPGDLPPHGIIPRQTGWRSGGLVSVLQQLSQSSRSFHHTVDRGYVRARRQAPHVQPKEPDCLFPPSEPLIDCPQCESMLTTLSPQGCVWTLAVTGRDPLHASQGEDIRRRLRIFECSTVLGGEGARLGLVAQQCNHHNYWAML